MSSAKAEEERADLFCSPPSGFTILEAVPSRVFSELPALYLPAVVFVIFSQKWFQHLSQLLLCYHLHHAPHDLAGRCFIAGRLCVSIIGQR